MHILAVYIIPTFTEGGSARFDRLKKAYEHPLTEVYLMFYQAALQLFITFNKFLQREDPLIHVITEQMSSFMKKLLGKFVSVSAIKAATDITEVEYRENQLPGMYCIDTCTILEGRQYFHYYQLLYLTFSRLSRQCFVHWYCYKAISQKVGK